MVGLGCLTGLGAGITTTHLKKPPSSSAEGVAASLLHHHPMPLEDLGFLQQKNYSRRVAVMRFGESSNSRALQNIGNQNVCLHCRFGVCTLVANDSDGEYADREYLDVVLPLPMLAVCSQPGLWHRQRLSLCNSVAVEDFHFYRQFCALFHYSTVGISGNNVDGNARSWIFSAVL